MSLVLKSNDIDKQFAFVVKYFSHIVIYRYEFVVVRNFECIKH